MKHLEALDFDSYYTRKYAGHLLPPLNKVMKNSTLGVAERNRIIRWIADGSLAVTATGSGWSSALSAQLVGALLLQSQLPQQRPEDQNHDHHHHHHQQQQQQQRLRRTRSTRGKQTRRRRNYGVTHDRIEALQSVVPGGKQLRSSSSLEEAVDYMMFLEVQVGVLQSLIAAVDSQQQEVTLCSSPPPLTSS